MDTTLLSVIVENTIVPPFTEEPASDEMTTVLPLSVEKARVENPPSVDTISVDTFAVLSLMVETFN